MVVAGALAKAGASSRGTKVTCTVTADKSDAGIKITTSKLEVVAEGLTGNGCRDIRENREGRRRPMSGLECASRDDGDRSRGEE